MPEGAFSSLSLVMRYIFVVLCVLIVFSSFLWLMRDRRRRHQRVRHLPDAGMIGEFVMLSMGEDGDYAEGDVLPVPWEGCLGSSPSCDVVLKGPGIAPVHLYFSFHRKSGLQLEMAGKKCICYADGEEQTYHMRKPGSLLHGSVLQAGDYVLRLRLFAGLYTPEKGRTEKQDMENYGMKIDSQGKPHTGYDGAREPQTEQEAFGELKYVPGGRGRRKKERRP